MENPIAYIDESGDVNFNDGATKTFMLTAIVVDFEDQGSIEDFFISLKDRYKIKELKSSKIGDYNKRVEIVNELLTLKIKIVSVLVYKDKLKGNWFRYKQSFYKYVQRRLHKELYGLYGKLSVHIDQYGTEEYQVSLYEYLVKSLQEELFEPSLNISSAKYNSLIQMTDFISGTLRKCMNNEFNDNDKLLDAIKSKWKTRIELPDNGHFLSPDIYEETDNFNTFILDEVKKYLEKNHEKEEPKIKILEYLYYSAIDNPNNYVYSNELIEWLNIQGYKITEEQFRNVIIASLRDDGLIIVGTRKGMKLPCSINDLMEYISFSTNLTLPILKRMKKALNILESRNIIDYEKLLIPKELRNILNHVNI